MATYKKLEINNSKVQVESAIRDGAGKNIQNNYTKQDGAYENFIAGNLLTDQNWKWVNDFQFGTGTVDTVFDGTATFAAVRGKREWTGTTPSYVNVVSNTSVFFNLYNPTTHYAHVVESNDDNAGLCVYGTGITTSTVMEFCEEPTFTDTITELALTEETSSTGETYLQCLAPADGYLRVKNAEPEDLCIANVWGGNRVEYHPEYSEAVVSIGTATYFPYGMKSIVVNNEEVVYDEMRANKYFTRVGAKTFAAAPSVTYSAASGTYNIYYMDINETNYGRVFQKGACEIGGSTKFAWTDIGQMTSSTAISADCMSLYRSGNTSRIYFAIAQSEDTTYTYSEDTAVVDAESFATELAAKGALYTKDGDVYTSVTEYVSGTTYYYVSATDLHGLNGKAITDEIASKTLLYQINAMDNTYAGSAISPALNWDYAMGDFGTEELTLASGFPVVPYWVVYYPINVKETVQQLPDNYMSKESAESLLHQVGELQGFDFEGISKNADTGNWQIDGLVDTKETIILFDTFGNGLNNTTVNQVYVNKIYNIPSIKCLLLLYSADITTTRPGYQCGLSLGWKISNILGGGSYNEIDIRIEASVQDQWLGVDTFSCIFVRVSGSAWGIQFAGTKKNYTNGKFVINALLPYRELLY